MLNLCILLTVCDIVLPHVKVSPEILLDDTVGKAVKSEEAKSLRKYNYVLQTLSPKTWLTPNKKTRCYGNWDTVLRRPEF